MEPAGWWTSEDVEFERGRISKIRARQSTRNHLLYNSISGPEGRRRTVRPGSVPSHDDRRLCRLAHRSSSSSGASSSHPTSYRSSTGRSASAVRLDHRRVPCRRQAACGASPRPWPPRPRPSSPASAPASHGLHHRVAWRPSTKTTMRPPSRISNRQPPASRISYHLRYNSSPSTPQGSALLLFLLTSKNAPISPAWAL